MTNTTHFGYQSVPEEEKAHKVAEVFHSVAAKYDVMNDLMSAGLHRVWKAFTIAQAGVRPGFKVLDIAGGTGDLAKAFAGKAGPSGEVWLTDINEPMLRVGRDRLLNAGFLVPTLLCDAEKLPFPTSYFDRVTVAFGLRNMTHKDAALAEMRRVLKPGGKLLVLEFSKVWEPLKRPYDLYSFSVLPWLGRRVAGDADSYRYLAESIRMHPDQETLKKMMQAAGLERVEYFNLTAGVAALHTGTKLSGGTMKRLPIAFLVMASALTITVSEVEAKRMGGGGSFGKQSQGVTRQAPTQSSQAAQPTAPAAAPAQTPQSMPAKPASPWRGILGGALLGLGLGALLSHFGLSGAVASVISTILMVALLALAAMFIYRMFKRRTGGEPRPSYAGATAGTGGYSGGGAPAIGSRLEPHARPAGLQTEPVMTGASQAKPWGVPADFDVSAFLRNAKTYFIRLQAAWDRGDVTDIREFTTPEMFAELRMQLQERGATPNNTDVVSLDAELLGVEMVDNDYLASVKFTGMIKEEENAPATPFSEVWNLAKPVSGQGGWVLAGIQQL